MGLPRVPVVERRLSCAVAVSMVIRGCNCGRACSRRREGLNAAESKTRDSRCWSTGRGQRDKAKRLEAEAMERRDAAGFTKSPAVIRDCPMGAKNVERGMERN